MKSCHYPLADPVGASDAYPNPQSNLINGHVVFGTNYTKEESIPVGCIQPACQLNVLWWLPLGVSTGGGISLDLGYPPPPHHYPLDILTLPSPWTYPPLPGHTHPPLVTRGGHHWRHIHPLLLWTDRRNSFAGGNNRLLSPSEVSAPPLGNPGSATVIMNTS